MVEDSKVAANDIGDEGMSSGYLQREKQPFLPWVFIYHVLYGLRGSQP